MSAAPLDSDARAPSWTRVAFLAPAALFAAVLFRWLPFGTWSTDWSPSLGVDLAFHVDGLSRLFLLAITGVGACVFLYATGYLAGDRRLPRLILLLAAFLVSMVGAVTADDLWTLFVFWEATSVLSFLLIGFDREQRGAREAARHALLLTGLGGLFLIGGFVLMQLALPGLVLSELGAAVANDPGLLTDPRMTLGAALVVLGAFTKSAQAPFHGWLPGAMTAPTPVSAYLHSATMVKLGVYLLARLDPAFGQTEWWVTTLTLVGAFTALYGSLQTLRERDLKRILAWSTVAALGTLTMLIGLAAPLASVAFAAFLLAHALYKAPLFFVVGNIDHASGTRSIDELRGLAKAMPFTAIAAVFAGLSMAGLPATFGVVAKDAITLAKAEGTEGWYVGTTVLLVAIIAVAVAGIATLRIFFGRSQEPFDRVHTDLRLELPPLIIAATGLALGMWHAFAEDAVLDAASAISPVGALRLDVLWPTRIDSVLGVLVGGALIYWQWDRLHQWLSFLRPLHPAGSAAAFARVVAGIKAIASIVTRGMQHGRLGAYGGLVAAGCAAFGVPALLHGTWPAASFPDLATPQGVADAGFLLGAVTTAVGAIVAVIARDVLGRLLGVGVVGVGAALAFLFRGAPDLAFTQLAVETVFVVVASTALRRYRSAETPLPTPRWRLFAALGFGAAVTAGMLTVLGMPKDSTLVEYFSAASVPDAHGRNVTNAIIVDFRALDTLGEIAVLLLVALATAPLLVRRPAPPAVAGSASPIVSQVIAWLFPLFLVAAVLVTLRGHHLPGGGFVGGLLAVSAFAAVALVHGPAAARKRLRVSPLALAGAGVALAFASGLPSVLLGRPFLDHLHAEIPLGVTTLELSTALAFDFGVLLCVLGSVAGFCLRLLESE